jgi:hypothetical protein
MTSSIASRWVPAPGAYDALLPSQQEDELAEVAV